LADKHVGGQAVIEGVMMRSPTRISTAVRKQSGEIVVKNDDFVSLTKRKKVLGWPVIRGVISLFEMLYIGIKSLNYSADIAMEEIDKEKNEKKGKKSKEDKKSQGFLMGLTMVLAFGLGILVFFFFPLFVSNLLSLKRDALVFNLVAGIIRVLMFLLYVWGISLWGEFRRVFEYHGASGGGDLRHTLLLFIRYHVFSFNRIPALTSEKGFDPPYPSSPGGWRFLRAS